MSAICGYYKAAVTIRSMNTWRKNKGEEVSGGFLEFDGGVEYISDNRRNSRLRFSETGIFYRHGYCGKCNISKSATTQKS